MFWIKGIPMFGYLPISKINKKVDPEPLLNEFNNILESNLTAVNKKLEVWKGVTVFEKGKLNRLDQLPELKKLVDSFGLENVLMINFYNLAKNSHQHPHRDMYGNSLLNVTRVHIPLQTNPKSFLEVEKNRYHLGLGEFWMLDTSGTHAAINEGNEDRIHLVIDLKYSPDTKQYFPKKSINQKFHLAYFSMILGCKLIRDIFKQPTSIINRVRQANRF